MCCVPFICRHAGAAGVANKAAREKVYRNSMVMNMNAKFTLPGKSPTHVRTGYWRQF